ncbi:MAG: hypothetical protein AB7Q42_07600 [Acidimicrobiia bacterium]
MAARRRPGVLSPFAYARRAGVYRGLLGGDRTWLALGGIVWGGRMIRKTLGRSETIAATEVLKPGEFVTIRTIEPPTRRERKSARRGAS